jgi:hypothetical protein
MSQTENASEWQGRVIAHDDFASNLAAQRLALGEIDMPRNTGNRRTTSKNALLRALHLLEARW